MHGNTYVTIPSSYFRTLFMSSEDESSTGVSNSQEESNSHHSTSTEHRAFVPLIRRHTITINNIKRTIKVYNIIDTESNFSINQKIKVIVAFL